VASRLSSRVVHSVWRRVQDAGAVTAERPGPYTFRGIGVGTRLAFPQGTLFGTPWIELGDYCVIGQHVTLTVGLLPGPADLGPDPVLRLGHGVVLGRGSHVVATAPITIGANVFCGPYCYVTSTNHSYDNPDEPVGTQWPRAAPVTIGPGSWLGTGAHILPGARLGRNVVVAAGAVVRGEVPDRAVVAGSPARVGRRWVPEEGGWQPPLRTPPPAPVAADSTVERLRALAQEEGTESGSGPLAG
jgi:acetyltransferase-like isoleucine patch superfamily enzyme